MDKESYQQLQCCSFLETGRPIQHGRLICKGRRAAGLKTFEKMKYLNKRFPY